MSEEVNTDIGTADAIREPAPADDVAEAVEGREAAPEGKLRSWWGYPATYALVGVNLLVFAIMYRFGPWQELIRAHDWRSVFTAQFSSDTLLSFGACDVVEVIQHGAWWRVVTATFVHATVLHIALNMWCLWNLGLFGEPLLGKPGLICVYLLTGVAGNMLSLGWNVFNGHEAMVVGASGAVFGLAGILIVLLSNKGLVKPGLEWKDIRGLRTQVILFAVANLLLGMIPNFAPMMSESAMRFLHMDPSTRVDNNAHLGGFLFGLALGVPLFSPMVVGKPEYRRRQRATFAVAALLIGLFGYALAAFAAKG